MSAKVLRRILLIEDEIDIQAVARLALETLGGFQIDTCSSGQEGIALISNSVPDLILLDVMMPVMDGPTTMKLLREKPETAHIPIVFMTAKVQTHEVDGYLKMGALGVIPKPFDPMTLVQTLKSLWDRQDAHT